MAMSAREHLNWAIERALEHYDIGDKDNAIVSFVSDVGKHQDTAWIQHHALTGVILWEGCVKGRDAFWKAMSGFNVGD